MPCIYLAIKFISVDLYNLVWIFPLNIKNNVTDIDKYVESFKTSTKKKINI